MSHDVCLDCGLVKNECICNNKIDRTIQITHKFEKGKGFENETERQLQSEIKKRKDLECASIEC